MNPEDLLLAASLFLQNSPRIPPRTGDGAGQDIASRGGNLSRLRLSASGKGGLSFLQGKKFLTSIRRAENVPFRYGRILVIGLRANPGKGRRLLRRLGPGQTQNPVLDKEDGDVRDEPGGAGDKKNMDHPEMSMEKFYHFRRSSLCGFIFTHNLSVFSKAFESF
jgi:hypothetical protein